MPFFETVTLYDTAILDAIQNIRCAFLDVVMAIFSYAGEAGGIWIIASIIMIAFKQTRPAGAMFLCAMLACWLIGDVAIKNLVMRPRPFAVNTDIVLTINPPSGYSFPSGHSASSFAAATVLIMHNKRFGIPAVIIASLIAFSRLYNYVHYPSDVLCGIALGILMAIIIVTAFKKTGLNKKLSETLLYKKGENE